MKKLTQIQSELKAPKNQFNSFGKYKYRSCEDILEALKPLLAKYDATLFINDKIHEIGGIIYVEAEVVFIAEGEQYAVTACAGINPSKAGMDISQSFGSSSSYARKYALNGLFLIDDTKDADATNTHGNAPKNANADIPKLLEECKTQEDLRNLYMKHKDEITGNTELINLFKTKKDTL